MSTRTYFYISFSLIIIFQFFNIEIIAQFNDPFRISNDTETITKINIVSPIDFNNDGRIDILGFDGGNRQIAWFENLDLKGSIGEPKKIGEAHLFSISSNLYTFDVNSDGIQDILGFKDGSVICLINSTETPGVIVDTVELVVKGLSLGRDLDYVDINGDGMLDLLVTENSLSIYWFEGIDNEGNFHDSKLLINDCRYFTEISDFDSDGDMDIVSFTYDDGDFSLIWYENLGGSTQFDTLKLIEHLESSPSDLQMADLDNDGDQDILIGLSNFGGQLSYTWYENNLSSTGSWEKRWKDKNFRSFSIAIYDIDNDGDVDLLANQDGLYCHKNNGSGAFQIGDLLSNVIGEGIIHADFNNDKNNDLVSIISNGIVNNESTIIHFGKEDQSFENPIEFVGDNDLFVGGFLKSKDINNDSITDCIFSQNGIDRIAWQHFDGSELKFSNPRIIDNGLASSIIFADLDDDRNEEIIVLSEDSKVILYKRIDSGYNFDLGTELSTEPAEQIFTTDLDFDGDIDIVVNTQSEGIMWLENLDGIGNFSTLNQLYPYRYRMIKLWDYDNDGDLDILTHNGNNFSLIKNENLVFQEPIELFETGNIIYFELVDFNNDGKKELIYRFSGGGLNSLFLFNFETDSISFTKVNEFHSSSNGNFIASELITADFDLDGDLDILEHTFNSKLILFENNGSDSLFSTGKTLMKLRPDVKRISLGDYDGDTDIDILTHIHINKDLYFIENLINEPTIVGCTYYDENKNGALDENEHKLPLVSTTLLTESNNTANEINGCSYYYVNEGLHELTYTPDDQWELTSDIEIYNVPVAGDFYIDTFSFGFTPRDTFMAGQMHSVSGITRCFRDTKFDFTFQNQGTTIITEGTMWVFQDSLTEIANQIHPIDTMVGERQWGWKFENLYPGETIQRSIELNIPGIGGDIGPGTLIDIFSVTEGNDTQGFQNFFKSNYSQPILCAYDPNDKLMSPDREGEENYTQFKDTLIYTVRFQNTGNDTAFTVVVRDTLDENLNIETFNVLATSHRELLSTEIEDNQFITFTFEDILLPDSTIDFNGSQGFVSYSIQAKEGLKENTILENTASIYFDFNPPIVTNTTQNTLVECLPITNQEVSVLLQAGDTYTLPDGQVVDESGVYTYNLLDEDSCKIETIITAIEVLTSVSELVWDNLVNISPNPTQDIFHIDFNTNENINHTIQIKDFMGKEIYNLNTNNKSNIINLKNLNPGVYLVQVFDKEKSLVALKKLVVL